MMNRVLIISFVLLVSSLVSISGQSIHFCDALMENRGRISYTINVPNGTFHQKFIVIKDHYWELDYQSNTSVSPPTHTVVLENEWSKRSDWLNGGNYTLGFGVRCGIPEVTPNWTQNTMGLYNPTTQTVEWTLFPVPSEDLTPKGNSKKSSFATNFTDFKPTVGYNTYSRQERNTVVLIQQKWTSNSTKQPNALLKAFNLSIPENGWNLEEQEEFKFSGAAYREPIPRAVYGVCSFLNIAGLFGVLLPKEVPKGPNGTIVLVHKCNETTGTTNPNNIDDCMAGITYHYCVTPEADDKPLENGCAPAVVDKNKLIDCSVDYWTTTTTSGGSGDGDSSTQGMNTQTPSVSDDQSLSPAAADKESSSLWWLWLLIILVIIIIIIIVVIVVSLRKGAKEDEEKPIEAPVPSGEKLTPKQSKVEGKGLPKAPSNLSMASTRSGFK